MNKFVAGLTGVLLLAGCAELDEAFRVKDPRSAVPGERTPEGWELGLEPGSSLPLERAQEIALAYSPSVVSARRKAEVASARLRQKESGILPAVTASANIRRKGSAEVYSPDESHGEGLSLTQLIYDFGKTDATIRQSAEEWLASQEDLELVEKEIAFTVRQTYFTVLKQQELIRVAEETVRQFQKRLEQVKGFVEVGTRVKYDLTKAQVDLGNAQLALVRARTAYTVSQALLNQSMGLAEVGEYRLEQSKPVAAAEKLSPEEAMTRARREHPGLQVRAARERAALAAVDHAIADFAPEVNLQASMDWTGALSPTARTWFVGPLARWIVAGWDRNGRLSEAVANLRLARAERAREEQQIFFDIRQAMAQLEDARERIKIMVLTLKRAEENLTLVQGRYEIGRASSVELTDAQVALSNAKSEQIQAEYDIQIAAARLQRAMGVK